MGFYDEIAKGIQWDYVSDTDFYLKVVDGKLLLPQPKWLQYHLPYLDKVIEAIHAFREGQLTGLSFDIDTIDKRVISDPEEGIAALEDLVGSYSLFSIDIESSNLSTDRAKNKVLCIGVAYSDTQGISFMRECFLNSDFRRKFAEFTTNPNLRFILHNGVFDRSRTRIIEGIELKIDEDTLLKHYCGINEHKGTHGLKQLAQLYLGFPDWEKPLDDWKVAYCRAHKLKQKDFQYDYFPQRMLAEYNVIDCCATFQLNHVFDQLMRDGARPIYRKLIEAAPCYADMIARGMQMDLDYWEKLRDQLNSERADLDAYFAKAMPGVLITSPAQLKAWLQKEFPFDGVDSTGAKVIEELSEKHPEREELQAILKYRKNTKYLKTYVTGLRERMDCDGIIHCEFKLHGTETGRLSSANPNMQNIPRNSSIKNLFVARPGYVLLQLDYSQAELRTLAHVSGDDILTQCYIDGRDLHSEMAQKVFGDKFDPHNKDQRMAAKIINFGIPYGRTPAGVAKQLKISKSEAQTYLDKWFAGAPKVKDYIAQCHRMATAEPQELYFTVFGRTRHYFITDETIHHAENQSVNFPISSTANDLTIHSFVEICRWLKEKGFDAHPVNTVHDSLIFEVRPENVKEIADFCQFTMADVPKRYLKNLRVPFRADAEVGHSWGDMSEPEWPEEEEEDSDD